jgi:hypothetical protein
LRKAGEQPDLVLEVLKEVVSTVIHAEVSIIWRHQFTGITIVDYEGTTRGYMAKQNELAL